MKLDNTRSVLLLTALANLSAFAQQGYHKDAPRRPDETLALTRRQRAPQNLDQALANYQDDSDEEDVERKRMQLFSDTFCRRSMMVGECYEEEDTCCSMPANERDFYPLGSVKWFDVTRSTQQQYHSGAADEGCDDLLWTRSEGRDSSVCWEVDEYEDKWLSKGGAVWTTVDEASSSASSATNESAADDDAPYEYEDEPGGLYEDYDPPGYDQYRHYPAYDPHDFPRRRVRRYVRDIGGQHNRITKSKSPPSPPTRCSRRGMSTVYAQERPGDPVWAVPFKNLTQLESYEQNPVKDMQQRITLMKRFQGQQFPGHASAQAAMSKLADLQTSRPSKEPKRKKDRKRAET